MYAHPQHRFSDPEAPFALVAEHPLGAWVCQGPDGLIANHIPFVLDRSRGPSGTLLGHVARANGVWRALTRAAPSVVLFQGPQHYITPGWYPGKHTHGEVVPTWNYAAVHLHGHARVIEDRDQLLHVLERLTHAQEARQARPWREADAPPAYIERLLRAIVGIEIPIDRIEARLKVSQDEAQADRVGTARGLRATRDPQAQWLADQVLHALETDARRPG